MATDQRTYPVVTETREQVAFRLMDRILDETYVEGQKRTRGEILEAYELALKAVSGPRTGTGS